MVFASGYWDQMVGKLEQRQQERKRESSGKKEIPIQTSFLFFQFHKIKIPYAGHR